jgi:hypothetical protein
MITILPTRASILAFRFRHRASLELELFGLRHQVSARDGSTEVGFGSSRRTAKPASGPAAAQRIPDMLAVAIRPSGAESVI